MKLKKDLQAQEAPAENEVAETKEESGFVPPKGQEHLAFVKIVYGRRFSPETGKEISKPYVQTFTRSEFRVFEASATRLGYKILEILHKPF